MSEKVKATDEWGRSKARSITGVEAGAKVIPECDPILQKPQSPEDRHASNYDNDTSGWVRGMGPKSPYPTFDKKGK